MEAALGLWELYAAKQVCLTAHNRSNTVHAAEILEWQRLSWFGHNRHHSIMMAIKDDSHCSYRHWEYVGINKGTDESLNKTTFASCCKCNVYSLYVQCIDYWFFVFRVVLPDGDKWQRWCQEF